MKRRYRIKLDLSIPNIIGQVSKNKVVCDKVKTLAVNVTENGLDATYFEGLGNVKETDTDTDIEFIEGKL